MTLKRTSKSNLKVNDFAVFSRFVQGLCLAPLCTFILFTRACGGPYTSAGLYTYTYWRVNHPYYTKKSTIDSVSISQDLTKWFTLFYDYSSSKYLAKDSNNFLAWVSGVRSIFLMCSRPALDHSLRFLCPSSIAEIQSSPSFIKRPVFPSTTVSLNPP